MKRKFTVTLDTNDNLPVHILSEVIREELTNRFYKCENLKIKEEKP
jgi:hypothetical protein